MDSRVLCPTKMADAGDRCFQYTTSQPPCQLSCQLCLAVALLRRVLLSLAMPLLCSALLRNALPSLHFALLGGAVAVLCYTMPSPCGATRRYVVLLQCSCSAAPCSATPLQCVDLRCLCHVTLRLASAKVLLCCVGLCWAKRCRRSTVHTQSSNALTLLRSAGPRRCYTQLCFAFAMPCGVTPRFASPLLHRTWLCFCFAIAAH